MKIVCVSDIHKMKPFSDFPAGDVLVFAGDATASGNITELNQFFNFMQHEDYSDKFPIKIMISGNHDRCFERFGYASRQMCLQYGWIYLEDSEFVMDGIKFYGSPISPTFGHNWAFNRDRGEDIKRYWDEIPDDTDVLITHGPPKMILDRCKGGGFHAGCDDLWRKIEQVKPKVHVFGHIHEGYGEYYHTWDDGKVTHFINASICNVDYVPRNRAIITII